MRDEILEKIISFVVKLFGGDASSMNGDTAFEGDLGFKSVSFVQLIASLEDEYDTEVKYMKFKRCATIGEAADFMLDLIGEG